MIRREQVLKKLQELSDDEVTAAIKQLTRHVKARLRFNSFVGNRTKSGAHGEKNLGMNAVDYYVGESIKRLYSPKGWDWKYEKFTLAEQLMRIANKLISDTVDEYRKSKDTLPVIDGRDIGDMFDIEEPVNEPVDEDGRAKAEQYAKLIQLAHQVSNDDDDLQYFTIRYFEGMSYEEIAGEMNITANQMYVLRKKLVRRLSDYKEELTL